MIHNNIPLETKPKEACGVLAISTSQVVDHFNYLYKGLKSLQHRGEDGAGIAWIKNSPLQSEQNNDPMIEVHKSKGLVDDLFINKIAVSSTTSIGHVRYGTQGGNSLEFVQPYLSFSGGMALAFNGQIKMGKFRSDTERLQARFEKHLDIGSCDVSDKVLEELIHTDDDEAFSAVVIHGNQIIAVRDCNGTRPLYICEFEVESVIGIMVASETCVFSNLNAHNIREVQPGSLIVIENGKILKYLTSKNTVKKFCTFEGLYFSREDSQYKGESFYELRKKLGEHLANRTSNRLSNADLVVGVPQSGLPAALGFSRASGIPFELGLIKSRYAGRSFIKSSEIKRIETVEDKLHVQTSVVRNKSVVVIDDTLVRGHTMMRIVSLLRRAGAKEVHVCIAAPPIKAPCYKGVDTGREKNLMAAQLNVDELRQQIVADSLHFVDIKALFDIMGSEICTDCFELK